MDMTFQDIWGSTAVYMDDIVVFSNTWAEPVANIPLVLQRLRESNSL